MSKSSNAGAACAVDGGGCPGCVVVKGLATLARIALGALFIFSGAVKLIDPQAFAFAIKGFKLVENHDLISQATFSIPWTEVLIGALLVLGLWTRVASGALLLMVAGFTAAIVSVLARDIDTSCGCFGKFLGSKIDETTVIRNVVLLSLTMVVFVKRGGFLTLDGRRRNRARADQGAG